MSSLGGMGLVRELGGETRELWRGGGMGEDDDDDIKTHNRIANHGGVDIVC